MHSRDSLSVARSEKVSIPAGLSSGTASTTLFSTKSMRVSE